MVEVIEKLLGQGKSDSQILNNYQMQALTLTDVLGKVTVSSKVPKH